MALNVQACYTAVTADCGTLTIDDITEYGNGELERVDVAVFLYAYKINWNADDVQLTVQSYDPVTVTQWQVESSVDGHHQVRQYVVENWDIATAYVTDDIIFHSGSLWKALQNDTGTEPSTDPLVWELFSDQLDSVTTLPSTVTEGISDFTATCRWEKCYSAVVASVAKTGRCGECSEQEVGALYRRVDVLLQGIFVANGQTRWEDADELGTTLTEICEDFENCGC